MLTEVFREHRRVVGTVALATVAFLAFAVAVIEPEAVDSLDGARGEYLYLALSGADKIAIEESWRAAGTPPPPYTDPSQATINALGGMGRTQGWNVAVPITTATDLLAEANIPAAIRTDATAATTTYATRRVLVKRVDDPGTNADLSVCVRLGPNTDDPALSCAETDAAGVTGGCQLVATGDTCSFTIRPIEQCTSYATCHQPLWAVASSGVTLTSFVSVSIAW